MASPRSLKTIRTIPMATIDPYITRDPLFAEVFCANDENIVALNARPAQKPDPVRLCAKIVFAR